MDEEKKSLMSKKSKKKDRLRDDDASKLDDKECRCTYLCINCLCSNNALRKLSCCGCFPISCGVYTIAVLIILLTILVFFEIFFMLQNDGMAWWYVFVCLCLLAPAVIGAAFCVMFIMRNRNWTRCLMVWACILFLISVVLIVSWNAIYFIFLSRKYQVTAGTEKIGGHWGEYESTRKVYVFYMILFGLIVVAIFSYFICVTWTYKEALENDDDDDSTEQSEKEEDEMMKNDEEGMKDDMMMDDAAMMDMM